MERVTCSNCERHQATHVCDRCAAPLCDQSATRHDSGVSGNCSRKPFPQDHPEFKRVCPACEITLRVNTTAQTEVCY